MAWKEINPVDWKPNKGEFIEGILVDKQENVGDNNSMLYKVETPAGVLNVWGTTILDARLRLINVGERVRITYKGLAEAKGGKQPAKIFKVETFVPDQQESS